MRRDPRVTIEVYSQDDPYDYVTVTGTAQLEEGEAADRHIDKMSEKYTGNPRFQSHRPGERRVIVRVTPERVA
jgi:nitroimidazol reductase NimA-like FMN-containing flavoprotein (pyridoxamine 5'-phosphate oxidase superfamily)